MPNKLYRCSPCDYEYEHLYFDSLPSSMQKPVPPCPLCQKELTYEPENFEECSYQCWQSEGGCGRTFSVEQPAGDVAEKVNCLLCGATAKLKVRLAIVHGKNTTKGASFDVIIGRDADTKWNRIHDQKAARDKIRRASGTQALTAIGRDEYRPIKQGHLKAVAVPTHTVNTDE